MGQAMKKVGLWLFLTLILLAITLPLLALQTTPLLPPPQPLSATDIQRAKDFLQRNDPRLSPGPQMRQLTLDQADLNLLLGHLALRWPLFAAELRLQPGMALLRASKAVPGTGVWLNVEARLRQGPRLPVIESLRIGHLPVPAVLANWALQRAKLRLQDGAEAQLASALIAQIAFGPQHMRLAYRWQADSLDQALATLWPAAEQQRISAYHTRLVAVAGAYKPGAAVSLAELLPPLFALARERTAQGNPPAAENRAAVLTIALHANHRGWAKLMPAARAWPVARPLTVTLAGREDFPLHFLVSAVIAIEGGGPLADAIGVDKELADARSGSGFSFNDIAADRAGTRFGLLAIQSPLKLQAVMVTGLQEQDFMPNVADLPEFMREGDFARRYGGVGAPGYLAMMKEIEDRLDGLAVFKSSEF